jgi:hypothetical protein
LLNGHGLKKKMVVNRARRNRAPPFYWGAKVRLFMRMAKRPADQSRGRYHKNVRFYGRFPMANAFALTEILVTFGLWIS